MNPSPNVNLSSLKQQLTQATDQSHDNVILYAMNAVDRTWVNVSEDELKRAYNKQLKIDKHKAWRKRNKRKRHEQQKTQPVVNVPTIPIEPKPKQKTIPQRGRIQQLTSVVDKLERLLELRRKKLEGKGHFFPETGNAFYNKVKTAALEDEEPPTIQPHPDDTWPDQQPLDLNAYNYWLQGWTSVDSLRRIRQEWDQYLVPHGRGSKIPPTFVSPVPPSSPLWAAYMK